MDFRQLQTIVAVADTGSFAGSAHLVNLTPSAVSQQIQALEAELGVPLFDRSRRPPVLNAKGEEVVRAARQMLQIMTETRTAITGGRTVGVLKIGAIRTVATRLVPLTFAAMRDRYAELSFHLTVDMSESLMTDVGAGRLDAAVVAEHVGVPPGLSWTPVFSEPLMLVAPASWQGASERELFASLPFIHYETEVPLARQIDTELSRLGLVPREIAVIDTMPSVVGSVLAGLGIAVMPRVAVDDAPPGSLYAQPFGGATIMRRIGIVQRHVSERSEVLAYMRQALTERALDFGLERPEGAVHGAGAPAAAS